MVSVILKDHVLGQSRGTIFVFTSLIHISAPGHAASGVALAWLSCPTP